MTENKGKEASLIEFFCQKFQQVSVFEHLSTLAKGSS